MQQLKEKNNLLNAITDHIVYQDRNHCIIWTNTAASNSLHVKPKDLIGHKCHELWHGKDKACRGCPVTKVFRTATSQKGNITSPDGRIWRVSGYPVRDEKGRIAGAVEITSDITNRIKTEEALRKSEERFRGVFENIAIGLYRTTPEGRILMANPPLIRMLGFSSFEDLTKRNLEENGYSPQYPRSDFKRRIKKKGPIIGLESAWKKKDGTLLYINENARAVRDKKGKIVYYEGTIEDITARKLAELQLKQSEMLYRELVEKAGIGILVDDESGKIIYANERAAELIPRTLRWS